MKKLVLATIMFVTSITLSGCNITDGRLDFPSELIEETYIEDFSTTITTGDEWNIDCDVGNLDIKVVLVTGTDVLIEYSAYIDDEFTYTIDSDNHVINITNNPDLYNGYLNIRKGEGITISIPNNLLLKDIVLETSNSSVDISEFTLGSLFIETSNGSVAVRNIVANGTNKLDITTSNDEIVIKNTDFAEYDLDTSNGDIDLSNINNVKQDGIEISADTSNGKITFKNVYVNTITIETVNDDVYFYNSDVTYIPDTLEIQTINGEIDKNVR